MTAALIDTDGRFRRTQPIVNDRIDAAAGRVLLLGEITRPAQAVLESAGAPPQTLDWAVAIPGPFEYALGIGRFEGVGKFESLRGVDVRAEIAERLRTAPQRIRFVNDAVAYGIGEWAYGASDRADRLACVTLGTGVGSAFLHRGDPVTRGDAVPPDGAVHHLTFDGRPLEDTVSTRAITTEFARVSGNRESVKQIAARARAGHPHAAQVFSQAIHALGATLAPWLARFDATHLVIGGSVARSWDLIEAPLRRAIDQEHRGVLPVMLAPSTLLDNAPLLGAASWLRRQIDTPTPPDTLECSP